jgi:hypothetical protein
MRSLFFLILAGGALVLMLVLAKGASSYRPKK